MRHSLQSHIIYLENTIQDLKNRLTSSHLDHDEILDIDMQLTLAESALTHHREAYALELSVSGSEPSGNPGGTSSGSDSSEGTNSRTVNDAFHTDKLTDRTARGSAFIADNSLNGMLTSTLSEHVSNN